MKDRSSGLTTKQRSAFILFDGARTTTEVLNATSGLGMTEDDVSAMVQSGFLVAVAGAAKPAASSASSSSAARAAPASRAGNPDADTEPAGFIDDQERYKNAYLIATGLTASLGLRGFRLNLAVEAASNLQELRALAPKIRDAVGADKVRKFEQALGL